MRIFFLSALFLSIVFYFTAAASSASESHCNTCKYTDFIFSNDKETSNDCFSCKYKDLFFNDAEKEHSKCYICEYTNYVFHNTMKITDNKHKEVEEKVLLQAPLNTQVEKEVVQVLAPEVKEIKKLTKIYSFPQGENITISIKEDTKTTLDPTDFGFSGGTFMSIKITQLVTRGSLEYLDNSKWRDVVLDQVISKADIKAKKLRFVPVSNEYAKNYASFSFKVNNGENDSKKANIITYEVKSVNDLPTSSDETLTLKENSIITLGLGNFYFKDGDIGDILKSIKIVSLPKNGKLEYFANKNWNNVVLDQSVLAEDIKQEKLRFTPNKDKQGTPYASFKFRVNDGKGDSKKAYEIVFNVSAVNKDSYFQGQYVYLKQCRLCHKGSNEFIKKINKERWIKLFTDDAKELSDIHSNKILLKQTEKYFNAPNYKKQSHDLKNYILDYYK